MAESNGYITNIFYQSSPIENKCIITETKILHDAFNQINEYLLKKRTTFNISIAPKGTLFQKAVWNELLKIPYGKTVSYSDIAKSINNPNACQAVGKAISKSPLLIIIPCHRVIGKNGSLTGFSAGIDLKEKLLKIENIIH